MLIAEILHTCADENVAAAAVLSVGGLFAAAVRAEADRDGIAVGALTAALVRGFAREASERDWRDLVDAMAGADHPVLSGVRVMVEHGLRGRERATRMRAPRDAVPPLGRGRPPAPFPLRCPA